MGGFASESLGRIATVDAEGPFDRGQIQLCWRDEPRATSPKLEAQIDETWVRELEKARQSGAVLFNGQLIRHIGHRVTDGVLHIDVGPTDYKSFLGTNLRRGGSIESIGRLRFANAIGVSALIVSRADPQDAGCVLLGHRSQKVVDQPGRIHTFGGALDTGDRGADGVIDVFAAVTRELCEELAITDSDLSAVTCLGLVHDHFIWQPELVFAAYVDLPVDEIVRRVDCASETAEHHGVERIVDAPESVARFVIAHCGSCCGSSVPHPSASLKDGAPEGRAPGFLTPTATPVALGALWLFGGQRFGDAWGAGV